MRVDVFVHFDQPVPDPRLDQILTKLGILATQQTAILAGEKKMEVDLSNLINEVADEKTVIESGITLMDGLTQKIADLIAASGPTVDPAKLQDILTGFQANKAELAAAITRNTPAAPPAPTDQP